MSVKAGSNILPVLLNIVEDIYNNLDHHTRNGDIPMLFVPQSRAELRQQRYAKDHVWNWKPTTDDFQVTLNVKSFKPEDISVKVKGREIIVEGKHDERQEEEHGYVSRHFTRRYVLPEPFDIDTVSTYLDADGKMTIKALKPQPTEEEKEEREIPIQHVAVEKTTPVLNGDATIEKAD